MSFRFLHLTGSLPAARIPAKRIILTFEKPMVLVSMGKNSIFYGKFGIF